MGRKKIGIFGGAFDPPTFSHLRLLIEVQKAAHLDHIFVFPSSNHRFKHNITDFKHRMSMCTLMFTRPNISVSSLESDLRLDGSIYALMSVLSSLDGFNEVETDIYYIIGQDNAESIDTWVSTHDLRESFKFIVVPRPNQVKEVNHRKTWYGSLFNKNKFLKHVSAGTISSTEVRENLKSDYDITLRFMRNRYVADYIKNHHLYN